MAEHCPNCRESHLENANPELEEAEQRLALEMARVKEWESVGRQVVAYMTLPWHEYYLRYGVNSPEDRLLARVEAVLAEGDTDAKM